MCECGHYWTAHNDFGLYCEARGCLCDVWRQAPEPSFIDFNPEED